MSDPIRLATGNPGKAAEFARLLGAPVLPIDGWDPPDENGASFLDNARIKARAGARQCPGAWVVADDSGLCVDALGGAPGVLSARYGGPGLDDAGRVQALLTAVEGAPDRSARFACALVAITPDGTELATEGTLEGALAEAPRGANGFGYDPILIPAGETRTCAELAPHEKDAISHRGAAARRLREALGL
ncbi:MAG: RdgB/HAM1 family non-canonical purine NTP pyrophosphatase [Actinobacteria bacterium]|nr:RdgB/HAM1 family non-canonical purine NTP pyrophosphatase [Actinomycetota bacterium]